MTSSLQDRIALVTGASGAIGGAVAVDLARRGARLLLTGRDGERLAAAAERARRASDGEARVETHAADLTGDEAVAGLVARLDEAFGAVDLLIHSLGYFSAGPVAETPVDELDKNYRINVRTPYLLTHRLLPSLVHRKGQVVFVNSSVGRQARGGIGAYSAAKHALRGLADSLRDEVSPAGVRVLTIFPGRTASRMQAEVHRFEGRDYDPDRWMQPEDVADVVVRVLELPRTAEVTDLDIRPTAV